MKITYFGHSAFGIQVNDIHIVIDPFITGNPKAASINVDQLKADFILLTHAHFDHVQDVEQIAKRTQATIISNHEIATHYEQLGYKSHGMNHGGSWNFDFGRVKAVTATHSSSFADGSYGGNPLGFVIKTDKKTLYIAGDTGLNMDMKLIPMFFKLDAALLPLGDNFTMDISEAVVASEFIECDKIIGMHYDTIEPVNIDHDEAKKAFKAKGKELILLEIGDGVTV